MATRRTRHYTNTISKTNGNQSYGKYKNSAFKDVLPTPLMFGIEESEFSEIRSKYKEFSSGGIGQQYDEFVSQLDYIEKRKTENESKIGRIDSISFYVCVVIILMLITWALYAINGFEFGRQDLALLFSLPLLTTVFIIPITLLYPLIEVFFSPFKKRLKKEIERLDAEYEATKKSYQETLNNDYKDWIAKYNSLTEYEQALVEHRYWQEVKAREYWMSLDGRGFEKSVEQLFIENGYNTKLSEVGPDGGIDIVVSKDGKRYGVQCKAYTNNKISESVIRDLYGTIHARNYDGGFLITLIGVSHNAIDFARSIKDKKIRILDIDNILRIVNQEERL